MVSGGSAGCPGCGRAGWCRTRRPFACRGAPGREDSGCWGGQPGPVGGGARTGRAPTPLIPVCTASSSPAPAVHAVGVFRTAGAGQVLELEAGHGRDAPYFARAGFTVQATDFSPAGLRQLRHAAGHRLQPRRPAATPARHARAGHRRTDQHRGARRTRAAALTHGSVDGVFARTCCRAWPWTSPPGRCTPWPTTSGVSCVRAAPSCGPSVRHTGDAHQGAGTAHGDGIYEHGGSAVRFSRALVDALAEGWRLKEVHALEEGGLARPCGASPRPRPGEQPALVPTEPITAGPQGRRAPGGQPFAGRRTRQTNPSRSRYTRSHWSRWRAAASSAWALSGWSGWSRAQEVSVPVQAHS